MIIISLSGLGMLGFGFFMMLKPLAFAAGIERFSQKSWFNICSGNSAQNKIIHYRGKRMLISNMEFMPGKKVIKHLGLVQGSSVRAKHAGKDIMAGFKNMFGGELKAYTELLHESREEATNRMIEQAQAAGANAILNVRFSTSSIAAGAAEIYVYGTGVVLDNPE